MEWWQTGVVYQIYPRSFQDSNGDGIGDLDGITRRVDYLSDVLGIDAVWLSPFYRSPMDDFGYDVSDHCDVDPLFGDLDSFDRLLAALHDRGIKLIVDLVPNHTSDRHPWFEESRSSRSSPRRDWYVWRDPSPDGGSPNNWLAVFGGPAWEWDEVTGQYYLHSFLRSQPDLNWRNPEVERAVFEVMRFWLDRGVDGFRLDVAHYIMKHPDLPSNPEVEPERGVFKDMAGYATQAHLYDKGHPDVHEVFRRMRSLLDGYDPPRVSIGEIHIDDVGEWARYYGRELDELHMPFNFRMLYASWDAPGLGRVVEEVEASLPDGAWPNHVLGNHDEPRLATRFGPENVRLAAMLLLTLRGTPTLYQGDELGLPDVEIPPEEQVDPWGLQVPGMGRDGCRTPMPWDGTGNAGFTTGMPWLPMGPEAADHNVASQLADPRSVLSLYRELLGIRRETSDLNAGGYRRIDSPDGVLAFERGKGVRVFLNFDDRACEVSVPDGRIAVDTGMERIGEAIGGRLRLRPREGLVTFPEV